MQIPMGTVVTVCMLIGALVANRFPAGALNKLIPVWLRRLVGVVLAAAGLWNVLWYGLRHLTEFWGHMALGSGVVMVLVGTLLLLEPKPLPGLIARLRPILVLLLTAFGLYYGWTIYQL